MFMSHKALDGIEPQTCMDDLESFYYTLLYIVVVYGKKNIGHHLPRPVSDWVDGTASFTKRGFLISTFQYKLESQLGKPFQTLVERLHSLYSEKSSSMHF
jgi:hypothetical protein